MYLCTPFGVHKHMRILKVNYLINNCYSVLNVRYAQTQHTSFYYRMAIRLEGHCLLSGSWTPPLFQVPLSGIPFTLRAFSRRFNAKRLTIQYICQKKETTIYHCPYSKDIHRTKCLALTIVSLTHSPYTTKIARIRLELS